MDKKLKKEIRTFFAESGIDTRKNEDRINRELNKLLGDARYENYLDIADRIHAQDLPQRYLYGCMDSAKEANTLITFQAKVFVDISANIYKVINPWLKENTRVGDLGCYTGVFINWLASKHKECNFFGFDGTLKAVRFSKKTNVTVHQNQAMLGGGKASR